MRRFWIALMAVALTLVMAVPVNAAKPNCEVDNTHPSCKSDEPEEPMAGTTCNPLWYLRDDVERNDFTVTLTAPNSSACIDVIPPEAGRWWVTVTATGSFPKPNLTLVPRDAVAPGDSCGGVGMRGDLIFAGPIPLPYFEDLDGDGVQDPDEAGDPRGFTEIPLATVNACLGNADPESEYQGDFAELVERNGTPPTSEIVFGPIPDEEHPLAFQIFFQGAKRNRTSTLEVCVDLPPFNDFEDC